MRKLLILSLLLILSSFTLQTFLEQGILKIIEDEIAAVAESSSSAQPTPMDNYNEFKGFLLGSQLLKGKKICDVDGAYPNIRKPIEKIISLIKGPKPKNIDEWFDFVIEFLKAIRDIKHESSKDIPECEEAYKDANYVLDKLSKYMGDPNYQNKVVLHSSLNAFKIKKLLDDFKNNYNTRKPYDNGVKGGELSRFVFFWDFNNN